MGKKKNWGVNEKVVEARARKEDKKNANKTAKQRAAEDAAWEEDPKLKAKMAKAAAEKKKREDQIKKRNEARELARKEAAALDGKKDTSVDAVKMTQQQRRLIRERERLAAERRREEEERERKNIVEQQDLTENLNRVADTAVDARSVDSAISQLSSSGAASSSAAPAVDRNPEKRSKATFKAFEAARLPQLRSDNPKLKLSQIKEMLWSEWQKSPENPRNQPKQ
eukprot:TRINITY_DN278_c0_g2_i6.p1 TRINITY_DN278_c0_g2~~TRINITY_DN278_c0_g2_i6.p1  ORF type:complete len:225 (+),score=55.20 TRINITY_DN278_c0_g2_i6:112-786(+)